VNLRVQRLSLPTSVTRLGEFSPTGRLFPFGGFIENHRNGPNFVLLFYTVKVIYFLIFGSFFTNSSGHPVANVVNYLFLEFLKIDIGIFFTRKKFLNFFGL
jgi:hypothetical protein